MPKLWNETIEGHRNAVREAVLNTTATLVAEHGLTSVTMSKIAENSGIGRATLYKYFADVDSILTAWHEREVSAHLEHLSAIRDQAGAAVGRLEAVLEAYAFMSRRRHGGELAAMLHRNEHVDRAQEQLLGFLSELLAEAARAGGVRDDVPAAELAGYSLHALAAASGLPSGPAVRRLVAVTLAGLRPQH